MPNEMLDFTSIIEGRATLTHDIDLIRSFIAILKNIHTKLDENISFSVFSALVKHIRTYGEVPTPESTAEVQQELEALYNEYLSITGLSVDPDLMLIITDNNAVIIDKFVHLVSMLVLRENVVTQWYEDSVASGRFSGTRTEFVDYLFDFFEIYDTTIPEIDPDMTDHAISLGVFLDYILTPHETDIEAHGGTIASRMRDFVGKYFVPENTMAFTNVPRYEQPFVSILNFDHLNSEFITFRTTDTTMHDRLFNDIPGSVSNFEVIDYTSHDQVETLYPGSPTWLSTVITNFNLYANEEDYNSDPSAIPFPYKYTEVASLMLHKETNYYTRHNEFVIDPNVPTAVRDHVASERSEVATRYFKAISMYRKLPKNNYVVIGSFFVNKIVTRKVRDIFTLTSFTKAIASCYLRPKVVGGNLVSDVVFSFDNFNPFMTFIVAENYQPNELLDVSFAFRVTDIGIDMFVRVNNTLHTHEYQYNNSIYGNQEPFILFLGPMVTSFRRATNSIRDISIFNGEISDSVILNMLTTD